MVGIRRAIPFVFFLFVFFLYFSLLSEPYFTDEQESFMGAYSVLKGKDLYAAFQGQHMPFSYYYAVPLAVCGARTVYQFRLGTYLMLALVWELVFMRHRRFFRTETLFLLPLLYLSSLRTLSLGTTMLADHWVGIGLIMILLEVIRYAEAGRIPLSCAGMIALGVTFSLGFSFASAYALFCFFLAALAIQLNVLHRYFAVSPSNPTLIQSGRKEILREDLVLVFLCLVPFVLLLGWYLLSGNLNRFIVSCFTNVTKVYSKYIGGLGSDPVAVVWTTIRDFFRYLLQVVQGLFSAPWPHLFYLFSALGLIGLGWILRQKSSTAAVLTCFAAIYAGLRGFEGFHSMPYHALTTASLALCTDGWLRKERKGKLASLLGKGVVGAISAALLVPFVIWAGYNLIYPQILLPRTLRSEEEILELLTEPEEEIFVCNMPVNTLDVMDLELVPKENCFAIIYPFFYETWGDRMMTSIRDNPPIVLYNPEERNAGLAFREYAPDFDAYMKDYYLRLPQAETIWIFSDFQSDALHRLQEAGYGNLVISNTVDTTRNHPVKYFSGQSVSAFFTAERESLTAIRFCAACFHRRSDPTVRFILRDGETGEELAQNILTGADIADDLFSRCPLPASLIPGRTYQLELSIEQIRGKGDMEFYFTPEEKLALGEEYQE